MLGSKGCCRTDESSSLLLPVAIVCPPTGEINRFPALHKFLAISFKGD